MVWAEISKVAMPDGRTMYSYVETALNTGSKSWAFTDRVPERCIAAEFLGAHADIDVDSTVADRYMRMQALSPNAVLSTIGPTATALVQSSEAVDIMYLPQAISTFNNATAPQFHSVGVCSGIYLNAGGSLEFDLIDAEMADDMVIYVMMALTFAV